MLAGRHLWAGGLLASLLITVSGVNDVIVYNDSASMPRGFYLRLSAPPLQGAMVTVRARDVALAYARQRNFAGPRARFIKRVIAVAGARICASGDTVTIGALTVRRIEKDAQGRSLPLWRGCRLLRSGELFLLGDTADSFDSRYFGAVNERQIEGVWRKL